MFVFLHFGNSTISTDYLFSEILHFAMEKYQAVSPFFKYSSPFNLSCRVESLPFSTNHATEVIDAGTLFQLPVVVIKPQSIIAWTFTLLDYDCYFGISSMRNQEDEKYLVRKQLISANTECSGTYVVSKPGTYYLVWDNSYSWFRQRTLIYSFTVKNPPPSIQELHKGSV